MVKPPLVLVLAAAAAAGSVIAQPAPEASIEGTWLGTVRASGGQAADVGLAFRRAADGKLHMSFYMPSMHVYGADLGPVAPAGGLVEFAPLDIRLSLSGERLAGTFAKAALPIELRRGGAFGPEPPLPAYADGPPALWSRPLGAGAWASPVARDGVVYIGTTDGRFHALRAADGTDLWTSDGPSPVYGTALATADAVYVLDARSDLSCLGRGDGRLRWRARLHDGAAPENQSFNHRTAAPVCDGGAVYVGSADGAAYALDAASGRVRWRHDARSPIYARATLDGGRVWFACYDGSTLALDLATAQEVSRFRLPGPVVSAPILSGGVVVEGCRDYMLYGIRPADGSVAWRYSYWFSWVESTPAPADGVLYVGASDFSRITAFRPATGEIVWSTDVHGMSWGTPLVTPDTVYAGTAGQRDALIRHQGSLVALDRASGAILWRLPVKPDPAAAITGYAGSPASCGSAIIVASVDGTIAAYPFARRGAVPGPVAQPRPPAN